MRAPALRRQARHRPDWRLPARDDPWANRHRCRPPRRRAGDRVHARGSTTRPRARARPRRSSRHRRRAARHGLEMLLRGWAQYFGGEFASALSHFARGCDHPPRRQHVVLALENKTVGEALSLLARGRIAEALDVADGAVEDARWAARSRSCGRCCAGRARGGRRSGRGRAGGRGRRSR